jgi:hypothetical protein
MRPRLSKSIDPREVEPKFHLPPGAVWGMTARATFIAPPNTPCLRCIFPEGAPQETFPILGATAGIIGCVQAMEALKFLTGIGPALQGKLLIFDGEEMSLNSLRIERRPSKTDIRDSMFCEASSCARAIATRVESARNLIVSLFSCTGRGSHL